LLAIEYGYGLVVEPVGLVKRGRDADDSKLAKLLARIMQRFDGYGALGAALV
jgi:hypothetical protein